MRRIYFAGPLFTQAEWQWNSALATELRKLSVEVVLPQERSIPMLNQEEKFDAGILFTDNIAGIEKSDAVLAILDQPDADSGTCWECGYAYHAGIPVIGLRTDLRAGGDDTTRPVNLMLARSCKEFINLPYDKRNDSAWIVQQVSEAMNHILQSKPEHA